MALDEQGVLFGVQATGDVLRQLLHGAAAQVSGGLAHGDGVQIRHKIVTVKGFRPFRPIFDGAQVRTEGQITAGLDTGKHDFFFIHVNTTFSLAVGQKPIGRVFYYVRSVYHVYTKIAIKL